MFRNRPWQSLLGLAGAITLGLAVLLPGERQASAAGGTIAGDATTLQGSVLGIGTSINSIVLPASGSPVGMSLPITANADVSLVVGELTLGVTADSVSTSCQGDPDGSTVWAECISRIEGLRIGLNLSTLGGLVQTGATVVEADVLQAQSNSSATAGPAQSTSSGTIVAGRCVYSNGTTCTTVSGSATLNVSALGVVTGTVQVFAQQPRSSEGAVAGSGLTVTMLRVSLSTVLGPLLSIDIAVADSFVGNTEALAVETPPATPSATAPAATGTPPPATPTTPGATPPPATATATPPGTTPTAPATATQPPSPGTTPGPNATPGAGVAPPFDPGTPFDPFEPLPPAPPPSGEVAPPAQTPVAGPPPSNPGAPGGPRVTPPPGFIPKPPATGTGRAARESSGGEPWLVVAGLSVIVVSAATMRTAKRR